jgi:glycosyltransferase involved in cell wall biosynthesis
MMKILFYSPSFKTKRASHRLRGDISARTLREMGYDARAANSLEGVDRDTIVVFLKFSQADEIAKVRDMGAITLYDLCDNKFGEEPEYTPCCQTAHYVTVNSKTMAISVKENTGRDSTIIPDPYERPVLEPKFAPGQDIKILWFGSSASLKFFPMVTLWQGLEKEIKNYHFTMVTAKAERILKKMQDRQARGAFSGVNFSRISILDWNWDLQGQYLKDSDLVLMPVQTDNYRTDTKSANRLIDSLVSGKFVVTSPLASYVEFDPYTWQQDPMAGIKWAVQNPALAQQRIVNGQQYTVANYSPEVIAQKWLETFNDIRRKS